MVEPNQKPVICLNGHRQPNPDSKFCVYCGTPLAAPQLQQFPPQIPPPSQPPFPQAEQQQHNPNAASPKYFYPQPIQTKTHQPPPCRTCGGNGYGLGEQTLICPECRWLRPLAIGYVIDPSAFQWAEDGRALSALRSIKSLNSAAKAVTEKINRRWVESAFNGVRLGEKQMSEIYAQAVRAARVLGMPQMPDVYLSGECHWDCRSFGTDKDFFVVIGTALATNFFGDELLFLLAREMGHCRAGHALWKTVIRFFLGDEAAKKDLTGGLFAASGSAALVGGAAELPLLRWAQQAEITADRAGLLAVGDEEIVRRVLLSWSLKSPLLYRQVNVEAWLEQQAAGEDDTARLSELMLSSTPYITRRLKHMTEFARHPDLQRWQRLIKNYAERPAPDDSVQEENTARPTEENQVPNAAVGAERDARETAANRTKLDFHGGLSDQSTDAAIYNVSSEETSDKGFDGSNAGNASIAYKPE